MKIETKYDKGNEVHYMKNGKAAISEVEKIVIKVTEEGTEITYKLPGPIVWYKEEELFPTKEKLVSSL